MQQRVDERTPRNAYWTAKRKRTCEHDLPEV